jgi:hypothetical protein
MKRNILFYFLFYTVLISSQNLSFINAPSGLIIREAPNKISKRIGKLSYGDVVNIINKTGIKIEVEDEGKKINGEWVEIIHINGNEKGFIFSGYLSKNVINKGNVTDNYYLTKFHENRYKDYTYSTLNNIETKSPKIKLRNKQHIELFEYTISELEMYENTSLYEQNISDLINILKVVTIEITYTACCSDIEQYNYLVDNKNNFIELPVINNTHCDGPEPYLGYLFPNNKGGEKNKIIYAKITPKSDDVREKIEPLKAFNWNGKNLTKNN